MAKPGPDERRLVGAIFLAIDRCVFVVRSGALAALRDDNRFGCVGRRGAKEVKATAKANGRAEAGRYRWAGWHFWWGGILVGWHFGAVGDARERLGGVSLFFRHYRNGHGGLLVLVRGVNFDTSTLIWRLSRMAHRVGFWPVQEWESVGFMEY